MDCQKNTTHNMRHQKHTIKNKNQKNWKRNRNNVLFLGCKDCTDNIKPQEVKITNKVLKKIKLYSLLI